MALVGYTTRTDLSRFRGLLFGALIGLIAASVAFIFTGGSTFNLIIGYAGVLIFSGLTAYDTQRIKNDYLQFGSSYGVAAAGKRSVYDALTMYLNFINMFQILLSLFGGRAACKRAAAALGALVGQQHRRGQVPVAVERWV